MRLIAFYLPQFHPIAENDAWWGAGFTEWRNVALARPLFRGHEQPQLPGELGFYDLRLAETRRAQAALAKSHGVEAFCYYHYWFHGRRLLERPFEEVLVSGEPDFPFCLCWANESWRRAWSEREGEVLLEQTYSAEDDRAHARYLARVFADPRAVKVDGRPLFLVYRASAHPSPRRFVESLRAECAATGVGDPLLARVESDPWLERRLAPAELGFDAAVEFAPDWLALGPRRRQGRFARLARRAGLASDAFEKHRVHEYRQVVRASLARRAPAYELFRAATPGWDNTPRRAKGGVVLAGSAPALYQSWLRALLAASGPPDSDRSLVFVNAWNEWAEGCHLEPDLGHGRAYLEATRRAVAAATGRSEREIEASAASLRAASGHVQAMRSQEATPLELPGTLTAAGAVSTSLAAGISRAPKPRASLEATSMAGPSRGANERRRDEEERNSSDSPTGAESLRARAARARLRIAAVAIESNAAIRRLWTRTPRPRAPSGPRSPRERRPRVVVLSPYPLAPRFGGGTVRLWNLLRAVRDSVDLHVAAFGTLRDDPLQRAALAELGIEMTLLRREDADAPKPWSLSPRSAELFDFPAARRRLRFAIETFGADLLQIEFAELASFAEASAGRPVALTELDVTFETARRRRALGFAERYRVDRELWGDAAGFRRWLRFETRAAERMDQVHVMSEADGRVLAPYLSDGWRRIRVIPNGVDTEIFHPRADGELPDVDLLFLGAFSHTPNRDAVEWLLSEIWPRIRARKPGARLLVAGAAPPPALRARGGRDGIEIAADLPDAAPAYRRARILVAPIRAGSGTRLKLLEAFASGIPAVSTRLGAEGIDATDGGELLLAGSAEAFANATVRLLEDPSLALRLGAAARRLALERYDWRALAGRLVSAWDELASKTGARRRSVTTVEGSREAVALPATQAIHVAGDPRITVVIPTKNGGARLEQSLEAIFAQEIDRNFEVLCIDSGSRAEELARMRRFPVRVHAIAPAKFNHGTTRDLGARLGRGQALVFLNQDAIPADPLWLHRMTDPLLRPGRFAAVQGGIRELPPPVRRFFWESSGPRFYFTSESAGWIARHGGIGFSTVNAALRREAWERIPFGWAPILEDKKWQMAASAAGLAILDLPIAAVYHTHVYDLHALWNRSTSEGFGWRLLGERYSAAAMRRDLWHRPTLGRLRRGLRARQVRTPAELFFPIVRPLALYWGNRFARDVAL